MLALEHVKNNKYESMVCFALMPFQTHAKRTPALKNVQQYVTMYTYCFMYAY